MACDILNLEWASSGRDIDIVEPILCYLEKKYQLVVVRESIARYELKLLKYRPKILLLADATGAPENFELTKMASKLGILVVTLVAEGDYVDNEELVNRFFWGWNRDEVFFKDLHLEWSYKNLDLINKYIKGTSNYNINVVGATGFDRYKIFNFMNKKQLLDKYKKSKYSKVVGIAGFNFDYFFGTYFEKYSDIIEDCHTLEDIQNYKLSRDMVNNIYKQLIENNKDILFVLKYHPGLYQKEHSEFNGLCEYDNVLVMLNEENISDIINASDIWLAFNSTTVMEAWLLNKQTMLINPLCSKFERSIICEGSPIVTTYEDAQKSIDSYYGQGVLINYDDYSMNRKKIVCNIIQWDDGMNHIRAAEKIMRLHKDDNFKLLKVDMYVIKKICKAILFRCMLQLGLSRFKLLKRRFSSYERLVKIYNYTERSSYQLKYSAGLADFYAKHNVKV